MIRRSILAFAVLLLAPAIGLARPLYFENLTNIYGLTAADDIHACGVCHQRWEGTGGRNPYGTAVEQQLYLGKSIVQAITDIANDDTDGDGFSNGDELATYRTLPGYSCANFDIALNAPANLQALVTPGVLSCQLPKDIKVQPTVLQLGTRAGTTTSAMVELRNNGSTDALEVTGIALAPGADPSFSISAPALPLTIPVGQSAFVQVTFAPTANMVVITSLRITSDDPDDPQVDVTVNGLSFVQTLAPAPVRGACLKVIEKQLERFTKARLHAWSTCYLDELQGVACDTARRDLTVAKAEAKLRALVGGDRDTRCAAVSLTPSLLGLPAQCGAPCAAITLNAIPKLADCAVCRQTAATDTFLAASIGTAPPDLPTNVLGTNAWRCNRQLVSATEKGIRAVQKVLGGCELTAVLAGTSSNCPADLAATLADEAARIDQLPARCTDTTGMLGCLFEPGADPGCLGTAATQIGTDLSETVFGPN